MALPLSSALDPEIIDALLSIRWIRYPTPGKPGRRSIGESAVLPCILKLSISTGVIRSDGQEQMHRMITSNLLLTFLPFFAWFDPELLLI